MTVLPVLFLALAAGAAPAKRTKDQTVKLAAPGLQTVNIDPEKAVAFMEHFNHQLSQRQIRVITTKEVNAMLGMARTQQLMGCPEEETSCMMELADALGVDGVVSGTIGKYGSAYQASITVVSSVDGSLLSSVSARGYNDRLLLEQLTTASWKAASEIGEALQRSTRKYLQNAVSLDVVPLALYGAINVSYDRALVDRWSLRGDVNLVLSRRLQLDQDSVLFGTEMDVGINLRHHFFDLAPLGLYVGGGLLLAVVNVAGNVQGAAGPLAAVFATTGFALTAEIGYAYALFDAVYLRAGLLGQLGGGLTLGVVSGGPVIEEWGSVVGGRLQVSIGYAF